MLRSKELNMYEQYINNFSHRGQKTHSKESEMSSTNEMSDEDTASDLEVLGTEANGEKVHIRKGI